MDLAGGQARFLVLYHIRNPYRQEGTASVEIKYPSLPPHRSLAGGMLSQATSKAVRQGQWKAKLSLVGLWPIGNLGYLCKFVCGLAEVMP